MTSTSGNLRRGALVVSLDFELHWGVRDHRSAQGGYAANLHGARAAIPRILGLFARYEIAATWATVGFLFARTRDELRDHSPRLRPTYARAGLSPYDEPLGRDEREDPLHFAPSLIDRIVDTPLQELASHTFSHYYCLEAGQSRVQFAADLKAARSIASERGVELRSLVLPRNQLNPEYLGVIADAGFTAFRGNPSHWAFDPKPRSGPLRRALRLADTYTGVTGHHTFEGRKLRSRHEVVDVPASLFLRPTRPGLLTTLATERLVRALEQAARGSQVLHLWWHPHNFGTQTEARLAQLERMLATFARLRASHGMRSLSMSDLAAENAHA